MKLDIGMLVALLASPFVTLAVYFGADRGLATNLSKAARNERRKLSANLLNSLSVALFAAAIVGGLLQSDFFASIQIANTQDVSRGVAICLAVWFGAALHVAARMIVAGLED